MKYVLIFLLLATPAFAQNVPDANDTMDAASNARASRQQQQTEESLHADDAYNAGYDDGYNATDGDADPVGSYGVGDYDGSTDAYQEYEAQQDN